MDDFLPTIFIAIIAITLLLILVVGLVITSPSKEFIYFELGPREIKTVDQPLYPNGKMTYHFSASLDNTVEEAYLVVYFTNGKVNNTLGTLSFDGTLFNASIIGGEDEYKIGLTNNVNSSLTISLIQKYFDPTLVPAKAVSSYPNSSDNLNYNLLNDAFLVQYNSQIVDCYRNHTQSNPFVNVDNTITYSLNRSVANDLFVSNVVFNGSGNSLCQFYSGDVAATSGGTMSLDFDGNTYGVSDTFTATFRIPLSYYNTLSPSVGPIDFVYQITGAGFFEPVNNRAVEYGTRNCIVQFYRYLPNPDGVSNDAYPQIVGNLDLSGKYTPENQPNISYLSPSIKFTSWDMRLLNENYAPFNAFEYDFALICLFNTSSGSGGVNFLIMSRSQFTFGSQVPNIGSDFSSAFWSNNPVAAPNYGSYNLPQFLFGNNSDAWYSMGWSLTPPIVSLYALSPGFDVNVGNGYPSANFFSQLGEEQLATQLNSAGISNHNIHASFVAVNN